MGKPGRTRCALTLSGFALIASSVIAADAPSFKRDIAPVLEDRCAGCHLTGEESGKLALSMDIAFKTLVGQPSIESPLLRVKAGDPEASYLVKKLEGTQLVAGGKGAMMPLGGPPVDPAFLNAVRQWIASGASDN
jgi:hypothetical protein